jgi:2-oxoglutarate/2-oxoacid ferredoxin oxidoreductase subunit beta
MDSMQNAIRKEGFSFVEIMSQCPVSYGKHSGQKDAVTALKSFRDGSVHIDDAKGLSEEELEGRIVVGKLVERSRSELTRGLRDLNARRAEELGTLGPQGEAAGSGSAGAGA